MNIDMKDLLSKMTHENLSIIDIRDKYKFNMGHIPGAINIPANFLLTNPSNYLDKDKTYYLCCQIGRISRDLTQELNYLGYHVRSISGGYNSYRMYKN